MLWEHQLDKGNWATSGGVQITDSTFHRNSAVNINGGTALSDLDLSAVPCSYLTGAQMRSFMQQQVDACLTYKSYTMHFEATLSSFLL